MSPRTDAASLFVPPFIVAAFVLAAYDRDRVFATVGPALLALWGMMILALAVRWVQALWIARRDPTRESSWLRLQVLTGAGRSMMWAGAAAIAVAAISGLASAAVLGVLGLASVAIAVTWTALVAGSDAPFRAAVIERAVLPEHAVEGDALREHVKVRGVRIPAGTRLFVTGRALRHGAASRYALGAEASRAEFELESELGLATRGDHHVPPLAWWLGDIFGLARGPIVYRGEASLTVLPVPCEIDGVKELLGRGGDAQLARPAQIMPTEGTFRIRDYLPGDDARRIHWVRSLQADRLIVRLPDEIPPAEPKVRVVLDSHLWGAELLSCVGVDHLLDALVRVWLGVGKELAAAGTRVTMVAAIDDGNGPRVVEKAIGPRALRDGLRLGARASWQATLPLPALLEARKVRNVVVSCRAPQRVGVHPDVTWIVVPEWCWHVDEPRFEVANALVLPHPIGSADNRYARRRAEYNRIAMMRRDRQLLAESIAAPVVRDPGVFVARPVRGRIALEGTS
ncbi:MAG TPA: DUF58 domain-containing protein [Kofleriaceae bacterium]|nr:DUF58 domain-containing protein [Kofleriaceae bacterium]